ncbi:hypothetical protein [Fuerstiella marisgermanici]|uniref:Uncharacterized protein n=1 Tax=Fuerstiella marisgermanici TaxID=1891926 RepID=A0A1P8WQ35_9PLAN|nr:hypothetical protein [Fuerstiella marisgermanici]APZ96167.1 hypothetical protein Fuma_05835 [Fuerstiella marisgermanici]
MRRYCWFVAAILICLIPSVADEEFVDSLGLPSAWQPDIPGHEYRPSDFVFPDLFDKAAAELKQAMATIERYVRELESLGKQEKSREVRRQLERVRQMSAGEKFPSSDTPRLHVVGLYEGGGPRDDRATVRVTDTSSPIVLCVCAHDSVHWSVEATDGVQIQRILVAGHSRQFVNASPAGVPVEGRLSDDGLTTWNFSAYHGISWQHVQNRLKALTGLPVFTRTGTYGAGTDPIVIGPERILWRQMFQRSLLKDLACEARRFHAFHFEIDICRAVWPTLVRIEHGTDSIATSCVFGPYAKTMQPVSGDIHRLIPSRNDTFLTLHDYGLAKVNPVSGTIEPIELRDFPKMHGDWPIALDSRRNRIYLWGHHLMSFDLDTGRPRTHRKGNSGSVVSLAYSADDDCLFGLTAPYDGNSFSSIRQIVHLNLRGADIETIPLSTPLPNSGRPNLFLAHDRMVIQFPATKQTAGINYVVDLQTGEVLFACESKPRS